jgi:hypothetical protein
VGECTDTGTAVSQPLTRAGWHCLELEQRQKRRSFSLPLKMHLLMEVNNSRLSETKDIDSCYTAAALLRIGSP